MFKKNTALSVLPLWLSALSDFPAFLRMMKAWAQGSYRIPYGFFIKIIAGITYIFFFIDFIPDFLPIAGWLDDVAVGWRVLHIIKNEIEPFRNWERGE